MSIIDSGAPVLVGSVSGAFGSWTTIWTPPESLDCLFIVVSNDPGGTVQVGFYDVGVGATPASILPNGYDIFTNTPPRCLTYPFRFPAGVPISVRAEETAGTAGNLAVLMYGYTSGCSPYPVCATSQILTLTGGANNLGPISTTAPGTLYGTSLGLKSKMMEIFLEGTTGAGGETDQFDVGVFAGPSSTSLEPIVRHIYSGQYGTTQSSIAAPLVAKIPPSQEIYLLLNSALGFTVSGCVRLFY